jgi:hypothetical protein
VCESSGCRLGSIPLLLFLVAVLVFLVGGLIAWVLLLALPTYQTLCVLLLGWSRLLCSLVGLFWFLNCLCRVLFASLAYGTVLVVVLHGYIEVAWVKSR